MAAPAAASRAQRQLCLAQHLTSYELWAIGNLVEAMGPVFQNSSCTYPCMSFRELRVRLCWP